MRGPPKEPMPGGGQKQHTTPLCSAASTGLASGARARHCARLHGSYLLGVPLAKFLKLLEAHFLHL